MKTSKMTKCLKKLGSKKLKLGKLQDLIYNIDQKEYKKSPSGYYCTNIQKLMYLGILEKNDKLQYSITKLGKKNILKPYAKNIDFYKNRVQVLQKRNRELFYSKDVKRVIHITKSNEYYFNKWENLQNQLSKILINQ